MEDCYINVNYDSTILCKMYYCGYELIMLSFSKFEFNNLDLLMHITVVKQLHAIHTYISYCCVLKSMIFYNT